jgi:polyphosphate kinase
VIIRDNRQAWYLNEDGSYTQRTPGEGEEEIGTHALLMNKTILREKSVT